MQRQKVSARCPERRGVAKKLAQGGVPFCRFALFSLRFRRGVMQTTVTMPIHFSEHTSLRARVELPFLAQHTSTVSTVMASGARYPCAHLVIDRCAPQMRTARDRWGTRSCVGFLDTRCRLRGDRTGGTRGSQGAQSTPSTQSRVAVTRRDLPSPMSAWARRSAAGCRWAG